MDTKKAIRTTYNKIMVIIMREQNNQNKACITKEKNLERKEAYLNKCPKWGSTLTWKKGQPTSKIRDMKP